MPADFYQRSTCRSCASTDLSLALPLAPTPLCDAYVQKERLERKQDIYPLDLYLCESCGLVQLVHVVDKEIIYRDYIASAVPPTQLTGSTIGAEVTE